MDNAININKVFCVSYPRTGTRSIAVALKNLGFNAWHYSAKDVAKGDFFAETFDTLKTGNINQPFFDAYDAFADIPIPFVYKQLDKKYPKSKFILTMRNGEDWVESMQHIIQDAKRIVRKTAIINDYLWREDVNLQMVSDHINGVLDYFNGRDNDLLVCPLKSMNYEILSKFLGIRPIRKKFPHLNAR